MEELASILLDWVWALVAAIAAYGTRQMAALRQKVTEVERDVALVKREQENLRHDHETSIRQFSAKFDRVIEKLDGLQHEIANTGKELLERLLDERRR